MTSGRRGAVRPVVAPRRGHDAGMSGGSSILRRMRSDLDQILALDARGC